jgi:putative acetyltransferase
MSGLTIRAGRPDDAPALTALLNLPGVQHGSAQVPFVSDSFARARLEPRPGFHSLVGTTEAGLVAWGTLGRGQGRREHSGTLGLFVHDGHVGQGIGGAMMAALTDLSDNWLGLRRLSVEVTTDNARAIALYERFGFEREGVLRAALLREGVLVDCAVMARLREAPPAASGQEAEA